MSDLASEKTSLSALNSDDLLTLIISIRGKRREGIMSAAQRRASRPKGPPKSAKKLVGALSTEQAKELLAMLQESEE